jgi:branched-chain amino acid transport system permease protein
MATLGFGMIVYIIMKEWLSLTGGNSGLSSIPALSIAGIALDTDRRFFCLASLAVAGTLLFSANIADSRAGRALRAVHGSEVAAATSGVDIAGYKLKVFVLSAGFAAAAGFLYSHYVKFISPQPFDFKFSIELVVMVVLGGAGSVWGGLIGAGLVTVLGEALRNFGNYDIIAFGAILMLVIIFLPNGLTGWMQHFQYLRRSRRLAVTPSIEELK